MFNCFYRRVICDNRGFLGALMPLLGQIVAPVASQALADAVLGANKVKGVPTPDSVQAGKDYRSYLDSAFPELTVHEKAGTNTGYSSGVASAGIGADSSQKIAKQQIKHQQIMESAKLSMEGARMSMEKGNVDKQARASVIASAIPSGKKAMQSALNALDGQMPMDFDTPVRQGRERLVGELEHLGVQNKEIFERMALIRAQAKAMGEEAKVKAVDAQLAVEAKKAGIDKDRYSSLFTAVRSFSNDAYDFPKIKSKLHNEHNMPLRRFSNKLAPSVLKYMLNKTEDYKKFYRSRHK